MATGYLESSFESTPGNETNTPTQSTKVCYYPLISSAVKLGAEPMDRDDELRNQNEPLPVIPEIFGPSWEFESRMYPDLAGMHLKNILGAPTTTVGDGIITDPASTVIPAGAYRHVWTAPFGPTGVSPMTSRFRFAYADQGVYAALKGAATDKLSIETPEKGGCRLKAGGPANYVSASGTTFGLTPTYESLSVRPFMRSGVTLSWLSGTATSEDFTVDVEAPCEPYHSLGGGSKYPDVMEKGEGLITFSGSIPKRHFDIDDWNALVANTGFTALATWTSESIIASSYPYKLFISMSNCQYVGGDPEELSNKRRIGASFDWKATYNGSASVTVTLVNATSSYA